MDRSFAKGPVISIIDDDESVRVATDMLVASLGFETHMFSSAEEFLESPRLNDTTCLILDVHMPRMNGMELQKALLDRGRRIPTIVITAFPNDDTKARAMTAGAVCFLPKPFEAEALITCIDAALKRDCGVDEGR